MRSTLTGHRSATAAVLLVGGGALAAGVWSGGEHGFALALLGFYLIAAIGAYLWSARDGDLAAIMRLGGDERQRRLDRDATAFTGQAMSVAAVAGTVFSAATHHGDAGSYAVMCAVGGFAYLGALVVLRHRS